MFTLRGAKRSRTPEPRRQSDNEVEGEIRRSSAGESGDNLNGNVPDDAAHSQTTPPLGQSTPEVYEAIGTVLGGFVWRETSKPVSVHVKTGSKVLFKSDAAADPIHPAWNQAFSVPIPCLQDPLRFKIYETSLVWTEAFGSGTLDVASYEPEVKHNVTIMMNSTEFGNREEIVARVSIEFTIKKRTSAPFQWTSPKMSTHQVTVVLKEGENLTAMDENGFSDPYVVFRLGKKAYKSKIRYRTLNPSWQERFLMSWSRHETTTLELRVFDYDFMAKDDFIGNACLDLGPIKHEKTTDFELKLSNDSGLVKISVTITGAKNEAAEEVDVEAKKQKAIATYSWFNSLRNTQQRAGWLKIHIKSASNLIGNGRNIRNVAPIVVVELVNRYFQTDAATSTTSISTQDVSNLFTDEFRWDKVFALHFEDIHETLEFTLWDQSKGSSQAAFLGALHVPLLKVVSGEKWFQLKDQSLSSPVSGRILLEFDLVVNPFKAAVNLFHIRKTKDVRDDPKLDMKSMRKNVDALKEQGQKMAAMGARVQQFFESGSIMSILIALQIYLLVLWTARAWMLPLALCGLMSRNYALKFLTWRPSLRKTRRNLSGAVVLPGSKTGAVSKTGVAKLNSRDSSPNGLSVPAVPPPSPVVKSPSLHETVQNICLQVQELLDTIVAVRERAEHLVDWVMPFLSGVLFFVSFIAFLVLFFLPLRVVLSLVGVVVAAMKMTPRKNYGLLEILMKTPSKAELKKAEELEVFLPQSDREREDKKEE